ncbi:MAG: nucleoside deaminase [Desulfobulbaceae bacterium]|nr:nucleoside deaminase [Desulfobulbaceae bacterium]
MDLALARARTALAAGEFPVGCVIADPTGLVAAGHRQQSRDQANELDHAEIVALRELLTLAPGLDRAGVTVYSTMEPCLMCYSTLLLNGVRRIVYAYEDVMGGGTNLDLATLAPLYREMRLEVVVGIRRAESLALFRDFFTNPANGYWQGSLLAAYTLAQS